MSEIDTTAITDGMTTFINNVFVYIPLGLAIIGIPSAIGVGIMFAGKMIDYVRSALM